MQGIKYFIAITHREFSEQYIDAFKKLGINAIITKLCLGTASDTVLNLLDLEKTEKIMLEAMVTLEKINELKKCLIKDLNIHVPGNGIALFIPVDGIGGLSAKNYFIGDGECKKEETKMQDNLSKVVLILTVCDKGNTDIVMDAARSAGATGGTVVRAQGTGAEIAKFFGVTICEEKEMVYIAAKREDRDKIMCAIMEKAGKDTPAHGVAFSLPVDNVVGISSLEEL